MGTPNYTLLESHTYWNGGDSRTIEKGAFVRPIDIMWVPRHCSDSMPFDPENDVFCYTHFGIVPIPKRKFDRV